ncbi:MAG TPA: nucleotidyltransferase family protein [Streptosporangiaceae bacterium]|nr:nucleotidyltransferase family protein [Streptosporangiaceae bacterium]
MSEPRASARLPGDLATIAVIGRISPDPAEVAAAFARLAADPRPDAASRLYEALSQSKVTRLALRAADALSGSAEISSGPAADLRRLLVKEIAEDDAWQEKALPKMAEAVRVGADLGGAIIKGLAVQPRYPEPGLRHLGDVDIHFPCWSRALPLVRALRADGWVHDTDEYPWLKWHECGLSYGQFSLVYPTAAAPYARVDLHMGPFSVGHASMVPLMGWEPGSVLGFEIMVASPETSAVIVAAHALGDQLLSMKDINDLHVLVGGRVVDWLSVIESCRSARAVPILAQLLHVLRTAYPEDAQAIPPLAIEPAALGVVRASKATRAAAVAHAAYDEERSRGSGRLTASRRARDARRYFRTDLSPQAGRRPDTGPAPSLRRRDLCWRLIPQEAWPLVPGEKLDGRDEHEELETGLVLVRNGNGVAVVCGADVFVPTIWGEINPASVALARRLAKAA